MIPDEPAPAKPIEIPVDDSVGLNLREGLGLHAESGAYGVIGSNAAFGVHGGKRLIVVEQTWKANAETEQSTIARAISDGLPSTGETESLSCAGRFVGFLRSRGETWWAEPVNVDVRDRAWVDCEAIDQRDASRKRKSLQMQVQRAMVGHESYAKWHDQGQVQLPSGATPQEAAEILMHAIENKREKAASDVVLLLDAVRLPWLALGMVVTEFKRIYGSTARRVGFREIHVVPWHVSLVARLDGSEQEWRSDTCRPIGARRGTDGRSHLRTPLERDVQRE